MNCELCKAEHKTRWYYSDKLCWIADCLTCGKGHPMLVFRHHRQATEEEREQALRTINRLFEYESIRSQGRKIPTEIHEHWHLCGKVKYLGDSNAE